MVARPETAYLYVMGGSAAPLKVGFSFSPERRVQAVRSDARRRVYLLGKWAVPTSMVLRAERHAHRLLQDDRAYGEWFNVSRERAEAAVLAAVEWATTPEHKAGSNAGRVLKAWRLERKLDAAPAVAGGGAVLVIEGVGCEQQDDA